VALIDLLIELRSNFIGFSGRTKHSANGPRLHLEALTPCDEEQPDTLKSPETSMEFTLKRNVQIVTYLLLALVATQAVYTALFTMEIAGPRPLLWGLEGVLFTILAAVAGAALVQTRNYHLGWSAIAFSAVLNVVQVSMGLKLFGPFGGAAQQVEAMAPLIGAVVALSFMIYNAAKILLGLAALVFGMAKMNAGSKTLGGLTAVAGVVTILANSIMVVFGRDSLLPPPVAGASGVVATVLLALCLINIARDD